MTFQRYYEKVDAIVRKRTGLTLGALPDVCLADWLADEVTPAQAATRVLRYANDEDEWED